MDGLLPYSVLALTGVALFIGAWWLAKQSVRWRLIGAGFLLALIVGKSVLTYFPVYEAALFPFAWYIYLQSFSMPLLMMLFFGFAVPQLKERWNRVVVAGVAFALYGYLGLLGNLWMVTRVDVGSDVTPNEVHHLKQSTMYTCAPSAAAIAVSYLNIRVSEREMAHRCLTATNRGTTRFNTYRGLMLTLEGTAWQARMSHASIEQLCTKGQIAVIDFPDIRHAITTIGIGSGVTLHDPLLSQPVPMDVEKLTRRYGGVAILVLPR